GVAIAIDSDSRSASSPRGLCRALPLTSRAQKTRPPAQYNAKRPCQPPDIEIGLRHPVNPTLPQQYPGECDPVHNWPKKLLAANSWERMAATSESSDFG